MSGKWYHNRGWNCPHWVRRLGAEEFPTHDFVVNSRIDRRLLSPMEAFEIGDDDQQVLGVVWSTLNHSPLPHARQSYRYLWHYVTWRYKVREHTSGSRAPTTFHLLNDLKKEDVAATRRYERQRQREDDEAAVLADLVV